MVSFVCERCQETIKKPKLDKHLAMCRNAEFTCIDCSTTFKGDSYKTHTSCVTEVEKYHKGVGGKGTKKKNKNGKQNVEGQQNTNADASRRESNQNTADHNKIRGKDQKKEDKSGAKAVQNPGEGKDEIKNMTDRDEQNLVPEGNTAEGKDKECNENEQRTTSGKPAHGTNSASTTPKRKTVKDKSDGSQSKRDSLMETGVTHKSANGKKTKNQSDPPRSDALGKESSKNEARETRRSTLDANAGGVETDGGSATVKEKRKPTKEHGFEKDRVRSHKKPKSEKHMSKGVANSKRKDTEDGDGDSERKILKKAKFKAEKGSGSVEGIPTIVRAIFEEQELKEVSLGKLRDLVVARYGSTPEDSQAPHKTKKKFYKDVVLVRTEHGIMLKE